MIDAALIQELETVLAEAKNMEERGQQADTLQQQASDAVSEESDTPNYPQAIELLEQAGSIAPWRKSTLDEVIATLRQRQDRFVQQCIGRASTETCIENYPAAEEWLRRADLSAVTDDQRHRNVARYDPIRSALQTLLDESRKGEGIEHALPRLADYRAEIGSNHDRKFDDMCWAELDDYLRQAEAQIHAWQEYMTLRRHAETAAVTGDTQQVNEAILQMSAMSAYTFLPIWQDTQLIRSMASIGERAERVRTRLRQVRDKLEQDMQAVTDDEIDTVVRTSDGFTGDAYADIIQDRQFLANLLPLYRARAEVQGYIEDGLFEQVEPAITALPHDIQRDWLIRHYKREAAKRKQG